MLAHDHSPGPENPNMAQYLCTLALEKVARLIRMLRGLDEQY
jgi:hypothetical protein